MFLGDQSMAVAGVALPIGPDGAFVTVRARLVSVVADEEALNAMFYIKGASGAVPCGVLCSVVNKQRADDVANGVKSLTDFDPSIVDLSCPDIYKCGLRTDAEVWGMCEELRACSLQDLAKNEHSMGIKYHPDTLLYQVPLRSFVLPATHATVDPMHVLFSNGLLATEIILFMGTVTEQTGASLGEARQFQADEKWEPLTAAAAISEAREKSSTNSLKAGATELLIVYPLLRAFCLAAYGADAKEPHVLSFMLLLMICDEVRDLLRGVRGKAAHDAGHRLLRLTSLYMEAFVLAYGSAKLRFKHHQLLHMPLDILRLGQMLSCWVCERKHVRAKQSTQNCLKLGIFSSAGMNNMVNSQLHLLSGAGWLNSLATPSPFPEIASSLEARKVYVSRSMRWGNASVSATDLVFFNTERSYLVRVSACLQIDDSFGLVVRYCVRTGGNETSSCWTVDSEASLYRLVDEPVLKPAFYRYLSADKLEVLH